MKVAWKTFKRTHLILLRRCYKYVPIQRRHWVLDEFIFSLTKQRRGGKTRKYKDLIADDGGGENKRGKNIT